MSDPVVWIIIVVFYAPLHFMLPILFLFIAGNESENIRRQLVKKALLDAAISMIIAISIALLLFSYDFVALAMITLMVFMIAPFIRILVIRKRTSKQP